MVCCWRPWNLVASMPPSNLRPVSSHCPALAALLPHLFPLIDSYQVSLTRYFHRLCWQDDTLIVRHETTKWRTQKRDASVCKRCNKTFCKAQKISSAAPWNRSGALRMPGKHQVGWEMRRSVASSRLWRERVTWW